MLMDISPIGDETVNAFAADGAVDVDRDLLA
jgi:hypothetical protein